MVFKNRIEWKSVTMKNQKTNANKIIKLLLKIKINLVFTKKIKK